MAKVQKVVDICDICGKEMGYYQYWLTESDSTGVVGEYRLPIDVCEDCISLVKYSIKKDMMIERYDNIKIDIEKNKELIELFKSIVRKNQYN